MLSMSLDDPELGQLQFSLLVRQELHQDASPTCIVYRDTGSFPATNCHPNWTKIKEESQREYQPP